MMTTNEGRERRERREAEERASAEDQRKALAICRAIRDDPAAENRDRLQAVRMIHAIKNRAE